MQIRSRITANPFVTILRTASRDLRIASRAPRSADVPEKKGKGERENPAAVEGTPFLYELLTRDLINARRRDGVRTLTCTTSRACLSPLDRQINMHVTKTTGIHPKTVEIHNNQSFIIHQSFNYTLTSLTFNNVAIRSTPSILPTPPPPLL